MKGVDAKNDSHSQRDSQLDSQLAACDSQPFRALRHASLAPALTGMTECAEDERWENAASATQLRTENYLTTHSKDTLHG